MSRGGCFALRTGDQMICGICGLQWDHNDPEPPACGNPDRRTRAVKQGLGLQADEARVTIKPRTPPDKLPAAWELEMLKAQHSGGMQAVYRLILDKLGEL